MAAVLTSLRKHLLLRKAARHLPGNYPWSPNLTARSRG